MTTDITTEARKAAIRASVEAAAEAVSKGQEESRSVKWKNSDLNLPVATVALEYVLLNPHSHRIRGQMGSLDDVTTSVVETDPFGKESQGLIRTILSDTEGYAKIRNAIARDGQLEPGVLTDAGVLINANTRAVALAELGKQYVRVTVLPSDATQKELNDIELKLQMEIDVKQDYTLTSGLLFIEDLISSGQPTSEIGRQLRKDLTDSPADQRKARDYVDTEIRLLSIVREVITESKGKLTFVYFDDKRQALIEIDQDYQSMKNSKPHEAARVRDAQLTGLLSGIDYRKLREIDTNLIDYYIRPAMLDDDLLAEYLSDLLTAPTEDNRPIGDLDALPGLELLDDDDLTNNPDEVNLLRLFKLIAGSDVEGSVILSGASAGEGEGAAVTRKALVAAVHGAIQVAIDNKSLDSRAGDILQAPVNFLRDAARSIDKSRDAYKLVRTNGSFDREAFDKALATLERAVEGITETREEQHVEARNATLLVD